MQPRTWSQKLFKFWLVFCWISSPIWPPGHQHSTGSTPGRAVGRGRWQHRLGHKLPRITSQYQEFSNSLLATMKYKAFEDTLQQFQGDYSIFSPEIKQTSSSALQENKLLAWPDIWISVPGGSPFYLCKRKKKASDTFRHGAMPFLLLHTLLFFPSDTEVVPSSGRHCLLAILGGRAIRGACKPQFQRYLS